MAEVKANQIEFPPAQDFEDLRGKGVQALVNDQPAFIGNAKLANDCQLSAELQKQITVLQNEAKTVVLVGIANQVIGLIAIQDTPKPTSAQAIATLQARGPIQLM